MRSFCLTVSPVLKCFPSFSSCTRRPWRGGQEEWEMIVKIGADARHEVITTLGLRNFAQGPLPDDHIPKKRKFRTSELAPFSSNIQFQRTSTFPFLAQMLTIHSVLNCTTTPSPSQIRVIINDGVSPLTSLPGCTENKDGLCDLDAFIQAEKGIVESIDWDWGCLGDWKVPVGWETVIGSPPKMC